MLSQRVKMDRNHCLVDMLLFFLLECKWILTYFLITLHFNYMMLFKDILIKLILMYIQKLVRLPLWMFLKFRLQKNELGIYMGKTNGLELG